MNTDKKKKSKSLKIILITVPAVVILAAASLFGVRGYQFSKLNQAQSLSDDDEQVLSLLLKSDYSEKNQILQKLPYEINLPELDIGAKSVILIDVSNGNILYEKNADEVIPPASMTKLFALYVVEEEIEKGRFSYNQIIPIPEECWACNMPPHSSLMFLGEGQKVTLEELLLGLSICSGNDAAYALAYTVCNSMEEFVQRMNDVAQKYGLEHTHFVESSGYSENNTTTAREMAAFCKIYLNRFPESLKRYHSVESFTYPKQQNLADGDVLQNQDFSQGLPRHITMPITQNNTNPLLGNLKTLDGEETNIFADGLKTGYIDESGYNLALTARCFNDRLLSVTMGGKGNNSFEGQQGRIHDGTVLMQFGFDDFSDFTNLDDVKSYFVKDYGTKQKAVNLVPAFTISSLTVPKIKDESIYENVEEVKVVVKVPKKYYGSITMGEKLGSIDFILGDYTLESIPLVADRSTTKTNFLLSFVDKILESF